MRRTVGILLVAGLFVAFAAVTLGLRSPHSVPTGQVPTKELDVSWAYSYASLADITQAADLVVVGHVAAILSDGPDAETPTIAATTYRIDVDAILKGKPPTVVVVKQTGGNVDGIHQVVADDALMQAGDRLVLYLQQVAQGPYAGDYFTLGGPQGRLAVSESGKLTSLGGILLPPGATLDSLASY